MAEPAIRRMTLEQFLRWDDGTDTRYELVDGIVVAMPLAPPQHGNLIARLAGAIDTALRARPAYTAYVRVGIVPPDRRDSFYVPDLSVSRDEPDDDEPYLRNPALIVEILSPSTADFDRNIKVAGYRAIPTVNEILLLDSTVVSAEVLRRMGDCWISEIVQNASGTLTLHSVAVSISMAALYRGMRL